MIATASEANHAFLRSLGAEPVRYGDGLAERVLAAAPDGVDVVADFVGGVLETTLAVLAPAGRHASIADGTVEQHGGTWMWVNPVAADLRAVAALVEAGTVTVEVARSFPLEEAADAFRLSTEGHTRGKIVVRVS